VLIAISAERIYATFSYSNEETTQQTKFLEEPGILSLDTNNFKFAMTVSSNDGNYLQSYVGMRVAFAEYKRDENN